MDDLDTKIAIVGMAGRFPGADSVETLWSDIVLKGREAITRPGPGEFQFAPYGRIEDPEYFDHTFFDISPAEARRLDPQHRLILESFWHATEDAGIDILSFEGVACLYASCGLNISYIQELLKTTDGHDPAGAFAFRNAVSMNSLATRVGYKLDLRGECVTVQCACSSSLVGVALACESILSGRSDLALVGGVSLIPEEQKTYQTQDGFILSSQGECRALTDSADGLVSGEGVAAVVLRPLRDALDDGNPIYAVISGTALNNDGKRKVGYTAPSVEGQVEMMENALAFSGVERDEVGFVECHGTGTDIGDAIEIRALRRVFEEHVSARETSLELGSIKSNIGHLGEASGLVGLIKAALVLHHQTLPPLVHADRFEPHPLLAESELLTIRSSASPWTVSKESRRCAAVSSLGIGGTNAHVLLEQAPEPTNLKPTRLTSDFVPLVWSAGSRASLEAMTVRLDSALSDDQHAVGDVAFTLAEGRARLARRRAAVAPVSSADVGSTDRMSIEGFFELPDGIVDFGRQSVFMFAGSGAYRTDMAADLLRDPAIRAHLKSCQKILREQSDFDLMQFLMGEAEAVEEPIPIYALQCAIFCVQIATARRLIDLGASPAAMIGSSLGEYVAACVAGALSLPDALRLVYGRGKLLERVSGGAMVLVDADEGVVVEAMQRFALEVAMRIAPGHVALSGSRDAVESFCQWREADGLASTRLPPNVAYHSEAIDAIREDFIELVASVELKVPTIPYVSNLTGEWITGDEVVDPEYWFEQMRRPVQLEASFRKLHDDGYRIFFEAGPGYGLTKFARLNYPQNDDVFVHSCFAHPKSVKSDGFAFATALGAAWMAGADLEWHQLVSNGRRVRLPTYPFDRTFFHVSKKAPETNPRQLQAAVQRKVDKRGPRNPVEEKVVAIWTEVLGVDGIGIDDNFFDIGGDSLEATRVVSRLQMELTPEVSIRDVMELRTVEQMASYVSDLLLSDAPESGVDASKSVGNTAKEDAFYCAFEMSIGDQEITVRMSKDKYEERGLPDGARNVRFAQEDASSH